MGQESRGPSHIDQPVQRIVHRLGAPVIKQTVTAAADHWVPVRRGD